MWICEQHGEQIPQHNGTSYRCPLCTARVVWRDAEEGKSLKEELAQLRAILTTAGVEPPTFREQMEIRYGSWAEYQRVAEQAEEGG